MGKHYILLTDIEALVVLKALSMLIQNEEKHEIDKNIADRVRTLIFEKVKADKIDKPIAKYKKCGECKYLDENQKKAVGYVCVNTSRIWRSSTAIYHQKSCKACKSFEPKGDSE